MSYYSGGFIKIMFYKQVTNIGVAFYATNDMKLHSSFRYLYSYVCYLAIQTFNTRHMVNIQMGA